MATRSAAATAPLVRRGSRRWAQAAVAAAAAAAPLRDGSAPVSVIDLHRAVMSPIGKGCVECRPCSTTNCSLLGTSRGTCTMPRSMRCAKIDKFDVLVADGTTGRFVQNSAAGDLDLTDGYVIALEQRDAGTATGRMQVLLPGSLTPAITHSANTKPAIPVKGDPRRNARRTRAGGQRRGYCRRQVHWAPKGAASRTISTLGPRRRQGRLWRFRRG